MIMNEENITYSITFINKINNYNLQIKIYLPIKNKKSCRDSLIPSNHVGLDKSLRTWSI